MTKIFKLTIALFVLGLAMPAVSLASIGGLRDNETSNENVFSASTLGFYLDSAEDFSSLVTPLQSSTRTISVKKDGLLGFKYSITAGDFSGELCGGLIVEASVGGGAPEYSGSLTGLAINDNIFSDPDDWDFKLSLPTDNSADTLENETCQFKFIFQSYQESLSLGQGYNDAEEIINNITAGEWMSAPISPSDGVTINGTLVEQCWQAVSGATGYVYQSCSNDPDNDGFCTQVLYELYPSDQTCKTSANMSDGALWWRVQAVLGAYTTSYSQAYELNIDSSHLNQVVINEFLPNPSGDDNAPMPNGEWVELYNNKGQNVDVSGWALYDSIDTHELLIAPANTNTGSTIISPGGFLVVYRNGDGDFALNNIGGDTVRLYNGMIGSGGALVDSYSYAVNALEGKSFARIPDGSNNWVDPIPTPGASNNLENLDFESLSSEPILPEPGEEDCSVSEESGSAPSAVEFTEASYEENANLETTEGQEEEVASEEIISEETTSEEITPEETTQEEIAPEEIVAEEITLKEEQAEETDQEAPAEPAESVPDLIVEVKKDEDPLTILIEENAPESQNVDFNNSSDNND